MEQSCPRSARHLPKVEARGSSVVSNEELRLAGQRHLDEHATYAVGCLTHVIDLRLGEEIHFIAQGLKKAFLERTWLKAQLTTCLAVVAKVS